MTRRPHNAAFTVVEVILCLALVVLIFGSFAAALDGGSDSFVRSTARGALTERTQDALAALEDDLRESARSTFRTFTDGLPAGQCLLVLASARDASGTFHLDANYRPDWQAAVVYCPYTTSKGVRQLRRYVFYDSTLQFPFQSCTLTDDTITLVDNAGAELQIDRQEGNPDVDPPFEVLCPSLETFEVEVGSPTHVTVQARFIVRRGVPLEATSVCSFAARN